MIIGVLTQKAIKSNDLSGQAQLRMVNARKFYGRAGNWIAALDGVSLEFLLGTFTAIMGPSGSGKSTLLQCAAGLDRLDEGSLLLAGIDPARFWCHGPTRGIRLRCAWSLAWPSRSWRRGARPAVAPSMP
jgi:ABC-type bacteriocin/lantibiotic exporter with double-glycine peptidase domain